MKRLAAVVLLLCACGSSKPGPQQQPTEARGGTASDKMPDSPPKTVVPEEPTRWRTDEITVERAGPPVELSSMAVTAGAGSDRILISFRGDSLPGYRVSYIKKPIQGCASGMDLAVDGKAWLEIRLAPAAAHDSMGVSMGSPRVPPNSNVLAGLHKTCDFEGVVTFVADLLSPNGFAVVERRHPAEIEVEVRK